MKYTIDTFFPVTVTQRFTVPWPKVCIDVVKDKFPGGDLIAGKFTGDASNKLTEAIQLGKDTHHFC